MKRSILAAVAVAAVTLGLAACNSGDGESSNSVGSSSEPTTSSTQPASDFDASSAITKYNRDGESGTRDGFYTKLGVEDAKKDDTYLASGSVTVTSNGDMMAKVGADEYGIGYSSLADLSTSVRAVKVEGVEASEATVKDGSYVLQRNFNYVTKNLTLTNVHDALIQSYVSFMFSQEGIAIIQNDGGILNDDALAAATPWSEIIADTINNTWVTTLGLSASGATNASIPGETIRFVGSTSVEPISTALSDAWAALFGANAPKVNHNHTGSGDAVKNLANGTGDIGFASRDFNESEKSEHTDYVFGTICRDAICPIVNPANPVENLTLSQLRGIFLNADHVLEGDSTYTIWSQVL